MELESATKRIALRYVLPSGREHKLNTKVPWTDLQSAVAIVIKLEQSRGAHASQLPATTTLID